MTPEAACSIVHAEILRVTGDTVYSGPFAGMKMTRMARMYYLLGTYELELHPTIYALDAKRFRTIVNVGACDGYYAVGLALRHPEAEVSAFEVVDTSRPTISVMALANGVSGSLEVLGRCGQVELHDKIGIGMETLIVMDCEGDENILLDLSAVPGLRRCHILVEVHEFMHKGLEATIRDRFRDMHVITEIPSRITNLADLPFTPAPETFTDELNPYWVSTIEENRPTMRWFYMEPKV